MIKIFYGDDRAGANQEIQKILGSNYEVIDGPDLEYHDLPNIFLSNSFFSSSRKILIRDITLNKLISEKIQDFINTNTAHDIVFLEQKIAKNSVFFKSLNKYCEFREFKLPKSSPYGEALKIYSTAKKDGTKAIQLLNQIKNNEDPIAFSGMIISIALKEFERQPGNKEKRVLSELSKLDIDIKTTSFSPWILLQAFLLRLSSL